MRKRVAIAVAALVALVALTAIGPFAQIARAELPSGAGCPAAPGSGTTVHVVTATLPADAGQNANGVCINCTGTGGQNNSAILVANAAGCVPTPTVGAGSSYVWADWGSNSCVAPGNSVKILFRSGATRPDVNAVTWRLADGSSLPGTGTVGGPVVGGVAELPALAGASSDEVSAPGEGSGWSSTNYAALVGGLAVAAVAIGAGGWYARRRWLR